MSASRDARINEPDRVAERTSSHQHKTYPQPRLADSSSGGGLSLSQACEYTRPTCRACGLANHFRGYVSKAQAGLCSRPWCVDVRGGKPDPRTTTAWVAPPLATSHLRVHARVTTATHTECGWLLEHARLFTGNPEVVTCATCVREMDRAALVRRRAK